MTQKQSSEMITFIVSPKLVINVPEPCQLTQNSLANGVVCIPHDSEVSTAGRQIKEFSAITSD
jgi:hypothetical protein